MPPVPTLLGLPYDASSTYLRGAAQAPARIREALHRASTNLWSEDLREIAGAPHLEDAGDLDLSRTAEARERIERAVAEIIDRGGRPLSLGGDHSVTYPVLRALGPRHPDLTILDVDAHPDLYHEYEGDPYSHASPFARIMEEKLAARLVQIGIRTMNAHQKEQAGRFGVEILDMRAWSRGARPVVTGPVYLTIDMDGIDPAFAPGVSHPEPGGLTTREVVGLIQSIPGPIVGADVTEMNPAADPSGLTAMVAAKIVKEIAARMLAA